jgi:hypothetical protein
MRAGDLPMMMLRRLLLALALVVTASPAFAAQSYTAAQTVRDKGMAALVARMGESRPVARLTFAPDEITAKTQADTGDGFVEWGVSRLDLGVLNFHFVSGPNAAYDSGVVDDKSEAYFRLSDIDLGKFDSVVAASVAVAKLEDVPTVALVEIARNVSILPEPAYGDIRWTVTLRTAAETALVYLSRDGEVIGADLSDTKRAQDLDLYASDDWPMKEAQDALASVLGSSRVHTVRLYQDYIFVTADHPTDSGLQRDYSWRLGGVTRGLVDTPNLVNLGMGGMVSFPFSEVDLTKLPKIKAAAREAFGTPDAVITGMAAEKSTDVAIGELKVLWTVEFRDPNGEEGDVLLDTEGNVVEVHLPESRLPELGPWLAPATVIDTLRRISETFGPDAKLSEISINDTQASIDIEDPQAPGEVAHFLMDAREVSRFGSGSFFASLDADNVFTPRDLAGLTTEQLSDMVRRTEERLKMKDGVVFRFTFSRHAMIMDESDKRLMVEIRYGNQEIGGDSGWMTFLLDGTQTDEMVP